MGKSIKACWMNHITALWHIAQGSIRTDTKLHLLEKINKRIKACIIWLRQSNSLPQHRLKRLQHTEKLQRGLKDAVLKVELALWENTLKLFTILQKREYEVTYTVFVVMQKLYMDIWDITDYMGKSKRLILVAII